MITIIHGDDISKSREYFNELRQKQKDFLLFDGNKLTITELVQNIEGSSLFGNTKAIFIEEFLTKLKKTNKESKEILDFMLKNAKPSVFVLWESKEILKRDLSLFKNAVVNLFKLPKNIFLFLDNLRPNNSKNLLNLFHQALGSGIKEELILFMMQRQFRILLALSEPSEKEQIEEISRLAPWQMGKLERQSKIFDRQNLKKIYKKLYEIEVGQKTGSLSLSLTQAIDFLLLDL
jgi:DNA polymerase III delta subunit